MNKTHDNKGGTKKPIQMCSKDGTVLRTFPSGAEAERITGISSATICRCCKDKRKTAGGYWWRYK